ncbi:MAG TPA: hypothetical protein VNA25_30475 [Phycisphaerae bacterium]|nr:hypothetical protein [Phycisphaerae bacterium]
MFTSLLNAGLRWNAREHIAAVEAASFPYLEKTARNRIARQLEAMAKSSHPAPVIAPGPQQKDVSGWDALGQLIARERQKWPLDEKGRRILKGERH